MKGTLLESESGTAAGEQCLQRLVPGTVRPTVLAYHELSPETAPTYRYAVSFRDFEAHVQLAAQLHNGAAGSGAPLIISFDDGHISNYAQALPALEKYSCKAIFFVIVGRISRAKDFMTWAHLREIAALGHRVEAHGWSHNFLTRCPDAELRTEVTKSKEVLENKLGVSVEALSAPHGRWNRRVAAACAEAGYGQLYTSSPWTAVGQVRGIEIIGRLVVIRSMDIARLVDWLTMGRAKSEFHRAKHTLKQSLRHLLGNTLYHRLWMRFAGWNGPENG